MEIDLIFPLHKTNSHSFVLSFQMELFPSATRKNITALLLPAHLICASNLNVSSYIGFKGSCKATLPLT